LRNKNDLGAGFGKAKKLMEFGKTFTAPFVGFEKGLRKTKKKACEDRFLGKRSFGIGG